ncbi:phosphoribosylformylglycinamidine cyclo-ligase [Helcobacillus sp. ACRRO]|uniref:phosphoribosylformylglycinamidine cyclo-ligase n=1 Tax=Helcobacillus TaxID=1161125 RepID=UPI001EF64D2C|nr:MULTISPECIES: phosphoribosylformylglycinamidine cyclo-ligase [Helcobacillus]MCG7426058.1 phosphoribosylformylglycinamidine cyclo-ligase [Helcobacillus sp. ACRRO]MDK7741513.1 phosphoribosylformylglycinamidine cyclo-ligase [Helcobacillus massiliensis]WOO92367.1 phosphoribosylformylglycinamidine cyclo-ligase [Helcobacillus massiliensis]
MNDSVTYASAGVDIHAGDRAVELMKSAIAKTHGDTVLGGVGGFAGLVDVSELKDYRRPLLASSTDGVGTKLAIAQGLDIHDTIGRDLVAMVVDDIVVSGAKPLAMTDYIACGKVVPEKIADIVRGVAEGCQLAQTPLVGGETAEHPGVMAEDDYDVAGAAVGVVEADQMLSADRVQAGDVVIGMDASGLHSNGYSLVRAVVASAGKKFEDHIDDFGRTLGEELLEPTRIYSADMLALLAELGCEKLHALSHITGGGLAANVARVIPTDLSVRIDRSSWAPAPVFHQVQAWGRVPLLDLEATLNMGLGMVAVVSADAADDALACLQRLGVGSRVVGEVMAASDLPGTSTESDSLTQGAKGVDGGAVLITGDYASQ